MPTAVTKSDTMMMTSADSTASKPISAMVPRAMMLSKR